MSEPIDIETDNIHTAWAVTPSEARTFVCVAIFTNRAQAERFAKAENARKRGYGDLVVVPAAAYVWCANTYDMRAGRLALRTYRVDGDIL